MTRRRLQALFAFVVAAATIGAVSAWAGSGGSPGLAAIRICNGQQPAAGYRYVVLQAWQYRQIAAIKKRSPGTQVLVYKDMASTRDDTARRQTDLSTGVSYAYADRYHPEWFLKDTAGHRVNWASWPHSWQMDIGSRSYQRAWARNVARDLRRRGWDGVFIDGISRTMQYPWYLDGRVLAKYPGPNDYARANTAFLRRVGPALRRRHLVVGNINDATPQLWRRWVRFISGVSKEWWTKSSANRGAGILTGSDWAYQTQLLREAQARHKIFIAIAYGPADDWPAIDYARASFLLFARGGKSAFSYAPLCGVEPSAPRWRADVGAPSGPPVENSGVWRRQFANGLVLVNPTSAATVTVPLGGRYVQPNGTVVTSVVLGPHTGLTLRRS
jgi:putative glycosyl hydrolase-like family 15 (GHL15) protein